MVPQVVDDGFRQFLWKSSSGGLDRAFLLRESRPDALIERVFQPGEEGRFLGIDLCALLVRPCPPGRKKVEGLPPCRARYVDGR